MRIDFEDDVNAHTIFAAMDIDSDGQVTRDEFLGAVYMDIGELGIECSAYYDHTQGFNA